MVLGKLKRTLHQYLKQDVDGLDARLLFGVFQKKVLGFDELPDEQQPFFDKIRLYAKKAKKLAEGIEKDDLPLFPEVTSSEEDEKEVEAV